MRRTTPAVQMRFCGELQRTSNPSCTAPDVTSLGEEVVRIHQEEESQPDKYNCIISISYLTTYTQDIISRSNPSTLKAAAWSLSCFALDRACQARGNILLDDTLTSQKLFFAETSIPSTVETANTSVKPAPASPDDALSFRLPPSWSKQNRFMA